MRSVSLFRPRTRGLDDKIADTKDRLTRIEGMDLGSNLHREQQLGQSADTQGSNRNTIAIVAAALAARGGEIVERARQIGCERLRPRARQTTMELRVSIS